MAPAGSQREFFARIADPREVGLILEHLPGVFYFVKDDQGRFMAANNATCIRCGVKGESELIGATDADFLPPEIARAYRKDDKEVMRSGKPLVNRMEPFYDEQRRLDWFLTTKVPLRDASGKVIGVIGVARRDEKRMMHRDVLEVTAATKFARDNRHRIATAADLARSVGVSERLYPAVSQTHRPDAPGVPAQPPWMRRARVGLDGHWSPALNLRVIRAHWDEILRLATSIKQGVVLPR